MSTTAASPAGETVRVSLWRQGFVILSGTASNALWKLLAVWALAHWLGPIYQGAFALALAGMSFGGVVLAVGLDYANAFLVGRDPGRLPGTAWNTVWLGLASLLLAPFWAWGLTTLLPQSVQGLGALYWPAVAIMAVSTSTMAASQGLMAAAFGRQRFDVVAKANFIAGTSWALGALLSVHISYFAVLVAWAVSQLVVAFFYLRVLVADAPVQPLDRSLLRAQLAFGGRTLPGSIARAFNMRTGLYLTSYYLSKTDVGIYGLLLSLAEMLLHLPTAMSQVILGSSAARAHSASEYRSVYLAILGAGLAIAAGTSLVGRPVIGLVFGQEYARGAPVLALLVVGVTVYAVGLLFIHQLLGDGQPMAATVSQLVALVLTAIGGVVLIPRFGMMGAAGATLLTYTGFTTYLVGTARWRARRSGPA